MIIRNIIPLFLLAFMAGGIALFAPVQAQAPKMAMLDGLTQGQWEIRFRNGLPSRRICLRNGQELIQIRHRGRKCSRYVVEDSTNQVTIQYNCPGNGYGRTSIRRESARLVQLEGQGIEGSRPFAFVAEARHTGKCR